MTKKVAVNAVGLVEGLSHTGYSLETAVADIIDNSIDAGATTIEIYFHFADQSSYIQITDNGKGMSEIELSEALVPGLQTKNNELNLSLGKYGLGLKSASFSQSNLFLVASKKILKSASIYGYSRAHIEKTKSLEIFEEKDFPNEIVSQLRNKLESLDQGTIVRWESLRLASKWSDLNLLERRDVFLDYISKCEKHISMVFHRFLGTENKLEIFINGNRLKPWDPFHVHHPSTQALQPEFSSTKKSVISVYPFILPPRRQLSDDENLSLGGPRGWIAQQGFYVYRNKRLVIAGGWLGFKGLASDEKHILARIKVDIPGEVDSDWGIDIMKSRIDVPSNLRQIFHRNAKATRNKARQTLDAISNVASSKNNEDEGFFWQILETDRTVKLKLNWENPFLAQLLKDASENRSRLRKLLKLIETSVPFATARMLLDSDSQEITSTFDEIEDEEIVALASGLFREYVNSSISPTRAKKLVLADHNFRNKEELLDSRNVFDFRKSNEN